MYVKSCWGNEGVQPDNRISFNSLNESRRLQMLKLRVSDVNHRTNVFAIKHDDKTETVISFDV